MRSGQMFAIVNCWEECKSMSKTTARLMLASAVLGFGLWATSGSIHAATAVQQKRVSTNNS